MRRGCRHQLEASGRRWVPFRLQGGLYTRLLKRGTVYVLLSRLLALRVAGFGLKTPVLHSRELRGSLRCRIDGFRPGARGLFGEDGLTKGKEAVAFLLETYLQDHETS